MIGREKIDLLEPQPVHLIFPSSSNNRRGLVYTITAIIIPYINKDTYNVFIFFIIVNIII